MTADELIRETERRFRAARLHYGHGTTNARDEAAWLVHHVLRKTAGKRALERVRRLALRRVRERIPLAYLLGEAWIGEHRFTVDRNTIVPRSFIGELLTDGIGAWIGRAPGTALDLCTGSGCLGILVALRYPRCKVDLADISRPALGVAGLNIAQYRLGGRVRTRHADLYGGLPARRYDLIVANPPYVKETSMRRLPQEFCREPRLALAGGHDGLDFVHRILAGARERLSARGLLVCEIGHNRKALERAYPRTPFTWLETAAGADFVFALQRVELPAAAAR